MVISRTPVGARVASQCTLVELTVDKAMNGALANLGLQLGERIRERRIHEGLTQAHLARTAGVSRRHLAALEKGANVSTYVLGRVAQVLLIPLPDLFASVGPFRIAPTPQCYLSAFISYGAPDEAIARRIYDGLTMAGVRCFFFPLSATPGKRLHRTMSEAIRGYDRVILLCSASALNRAGVSNEIEQVLAKEAEEGGAELVIPVALDECLFSGTVLLDRDVVMQIRQRVIADFRSALGDEQTWRSQMQRLLAALRKQ